jgi:hypothetical protein
MKRGANLYGRRALPLGHSRLAQILECLELRSRVIGRLIKHAELHYGITSSDTLNYEAERRFRGGIRQSAASAGEMTVPPRSL